MLLYDENGVKTKPRKRNLRLRKNASSFISSVLVKRTSIFRGCLALVIPITVVFIIFFNYTSVVIFYDREPPEIQLDIRVHHDITDVDFTDEDISLVNRIPGVAHTQKGFHEWSTRIEGIVVDVQNTPLLKIFLLDASTHKEVEIALYQHFSSIIYIIQNHQEQYEALINISNGFFVFSMMLFCILFAFILLILFARLTGYMESQSENIKILNIIGASNNVLKRSYMKPAFMTSIISIIVSFIIGIGINLLFLHDSGYNMVINTFTIFINLNIIILIFVSFCLPVYIKLRKNSK
jgi:hypothetical protein